MTLALATLQISSRRRGSSSRPSRSASSTSAPTTCSSVQRGRDVRPWVALVLRARPRLWLRERAAGDRASPARAGAVAVLVQPRGRDRSGCHRRHRGVGAGGARARNAALAARVATAGSVCVLLAGAFWFVERVIV